MASKKTKNQRVPVDVLEDLKKAMGTRFTNNLVKKPDVTEGFRLLKRMPEWTIGMEKIKRLPKREDLI